MNHLDNINSPTKITLSPKKQLDAILNHPSPMKLVRSMAAPDLLLIIRELGAESSLELIEMMHHEQIQEIFDFELWTNDQLNPQACGHYFTILFEANPDRALAQIYHLDIELIGLMVKMVADIYDMSLGEEPYDYPELYSHTPDRRFLVCFHEQDHNKALCHMLHKFLERLYERHMQFAIQLLEHVRFELASGLEETSLRLRQNRLLDWGILPREERLIYFSSLTHNDKLVVTPTAPVAHTQDDDSSLRRALVFSEFTNNVNDRYPFTKQAFSDADFSLRAQFSQQISLAVVNMHASLSGDFGDREAMMLTADYVKFLVELGLFHKSKAEISHAHKMIANYSARDLLRLGRTFLTSLRKRLSGKRGLTTHLLGANFCHADTPLREVAQAISLPEPRYFAGLLDVKQLNVRYFLTLAELNATIASINELLFRAEFCGEDGLGFIDADLKNNQHLSHANIFARYLINNFLSSSSLLDDVDINMTASLFSSEGELNSAFTEFVDHETSKLAKKIATRKQQDEDVCVQKSMQFKTVVLINLSTNWRLATA